MIDISRFVSDIFMFDTNNMSGLQSIGGDLQEQDDCSSCCEKIMIRLP